MKTFLYIIAILSIPTLITLLIPNIGDDNYISIDYYSPITNTSYSEPVLQNREIETDTNVKHNFIPMAYFLHNHTDYDVIDKWSKQKKILSKLNNVRNTLISFNNDLNLHQNLFTEEYLNKEKSFEKRIKKVQNIKSVLDTLAYEKDAYLIIMENKYDNGSYFNFSVGHNYLKTRRKIFKTEAIHFVISNDELKFFGKFDD